MSAGTSLRKLSYDSTGSAWLEEDDLLSNSPQQSFWSSEIEGVYDELDQKHRAHESIRQSTSATPIATQAAAAATKSSSLVKWQKLQDLLKQEQVLLDIEKQTYTENIRRIEEAEMKYWQRLTDLTNKRSTSSIQRTFVSSAIAFPFDDSETKVRDFLQELRWNSHALESIIEMNKLSISTQVRNLSSMFIQGFFATHASDVELSSDIIAFINRNIQMEIALSTDQKHMLRTDTLPKKILKDFLNQHKFTHPITQLFKPIINEIARFQEYLHLEPDMLELEIDKQSKNHRKTEASGVNQQTRHHPSSVFSRPTNRKQSVLISGNEADNKLYNNPSHLDKYARVLKAYDTAKSHRSSAVSDSLNSLFKHASDRQQLQSMLSNSLQAARNTQTVVVESSVVPVRNSSAFILSRRSEAIKSGGAVAATDVSKLSMSTMSNESNANNSNANNLQESREKERQLQRKEKRLCRLLTSVLDAILSNVEVIPRSVRIVCALVRHHAIQKYPDLNRAQLDFTLSFFIIDDWALSVFMKSYKPSEEHDLHQQDLISKNMLYIQSILKNVMKKQYFSDGIEQRLNPLIESLEPRVSAFFEKLLNLDMSAIQHYILSPKISQSSSSSSTNANTGTRFHSCESKSEFGSILVSLENVQKLAELVMRSSNDPQSQQLNQLARAVVDLGPRMFSQRIDLNKSHPNRIDMMYTVVQVHRNAAQQMFDRYFDCTEAVQPTSHTIYESFRLDYQDLTRHFHRFKGLLRTLLVHVDRITTIASFSGFTHLNLPFSTILQILVDTVYNKFNSSGVNVPLIASRLLMMTRDFLEERYTQNDMRMIRVFMRKEHTCRLSALNEISFIEKTRQSRLLTLIGESTNQVVEDMQRIESMNLKTKVKAFMHSFELNICVSSPIMRKQLSNAAKAQYSDFDHDHLWVEELDSCIHKQANLDFVKDLTGEVTANKSGVLEYIHCQNIAQFIEEFGSVPELEELLLQGEDVCEINNAYAVVMDKIEDGLKEYPEFAGSTPAELMAIQAMVSKRISKCFHAKVFPKRATYYDLAFYTLARSLDFLTPPNLEIEPHTNAEWIWKMAAAALNSMELKNTPEKKIACILECMNLIADVLSLSSAKSSEASADLMIPHFIYVLLKSKPRRMASNMNFVTAFQQKKNMHGQNGYFFIQSLSAIRFIENISPVGLKLISNHTFDQKMLEEQRRLGITFMKKRKRDGHRRPKLKNIVIHKISTIICSLINNEPTYQRILSHPFNNLCVHPQPPSSPAEPTSHETESAHSIQISESNNLYEQENLVDIKELMYKIQQNLKSPDEHFIAALLILIIYLNASMTRLSTRNIQRLFICSVLTIEKQWSDFSVSMLSFAMAVNIPISVLISMEVTFLNTLNWRVFLFDDTFIEFKQMFDAL